MWKENSYLKKFLIHKALLGKSYDKLLCMKTKYYQPIAMQELPPGTEIFLKDAGIIIIKNKYSSLTVPNVAIVIWR